MKKWNLSLVLAAVIPVLALAGLETGTYISSLVSTNPTGSDDRSQGDDHIRLIKSTILNTFPNITGAVNPTHTELNYVDGVTSAIQTQLDAKLASSSYTAADVLSKLLTVDGAASTLDADLLDGLSSASFLRASNNLSDVTAATARTNLGSTTVGDAVFTAASASAARTAIGVVIGTDVLAPSGSGASLTDVLKTANNLSDVTASTARTNLGVTATGSDTTYNYRANNLSDVANAATARSNLGAAASATTISVSGTGLSGGGDLSTNRTITIDQTAMTTRNITGKSGVTKTLADTCTMSGGSDGDICFEY